MESPSLDTIPQELLDGILACLPSCGNRARLSQTSKQTRERTLEAVLKDITLDWYTYTGPERPSELTGKLRAPRLDLLLRTLLETPRYASYVRIVCLLGYDYRRFSTSDRPQIDVTTRDPDLARLAHQALQRTVFSNHQQWAFDIGNSDVDAIIALLLLQCQNITSLTLGVALLRGSTYLSKVLANELFKSGPFRLFHHLRSVQIDRHVDATKPVSMADERRLARDLDWRFFFLFFKCAAIRDIDMYIQDTVAVMGLEELPMSLHAPSLRYLRLHKTSVLPTTLAEMLKWTPQLFRLEYEFCFRHNRRLDMRDLRKALLGVRKSLEHLAFTPQMVPCKCHTIKNLYAHGHCSVADFPVLETLHIPIWALVGWEPNNAPPLHAVLPSGLQRLCLRDTHTLNGLDLFRWRAPAVLHYLAVELGGDDSERCSSSLRSITVVGAVTVSGFSGEDEQAFQRACQRRGLTCELVSQCEVNGEPEHD